MIGSRRLTWRALAVSASLLGLLASTAPAVAQDEPEDEPVDDTGTAEPEPVTTAPRLDRLTSGSDRLFLAFAEEAGLIERQWWEGQVELVDADPADATIFRLVFALQPWKRVEMGGRIGFGNTDTPPNLPDGSGATDTDVWAKYHLGAAGGDTEFAVGALATIPTGDDTAGLGTDSFDFQVHGAVRHRLPTMILSAHLGLRHNGDGQIFGGTTTDTGITLEGKTSTVAGAGVFFPAWDRLTLVGEVVLQTERYERSDSDLRVLGGANWRVFDRGMLRGAAALGVTDGAPDAQLIVSYAHLF